jgi:hypothetical protein
MTSALAKILIFSSKTNGKINGSLLRPPAIYKGFLGHFERQKRHHIKKDS